MKPKPAPTKAQAEILSYIRECCQRTGIAPSYREIQAHFGFRAIGTVQDHVKALLQKGWLEKNGPRQARTLQPADHKREGLKHIPIYGEIAAGDPRDTPQIELGTLTVSEKDASDTTFALRVVGNCMCEAGILEGDHLIVERKAKVKSGDIVVALLDGETTVKRYVEKNGTVFLVPENRALSPIAVKGKHLEIQGKVVGLQRRF